MHPARILCSIILLVSLAFTCRAVTPDFTHFPPEAKKLFIAGKSHLLQEHYELALGAFNQSIKSFPHPHALAARATTRYQLEDYEHAKTDANQAIQLNANCAFAYIVRGLCQAETNEFAEALADFTTVINANSSRKETLTALIGRTGVYVELDKYEQAIVDLDAAINIDSNDPDLYYIRSMCWIALDHPTKALDDAGKAVEIEPWSPEPLVLRGSIRESLSYFVGSKRDFERAYHLAPKNEEAVKALAEFYGTCSDEKFRNQPKAIDLALSLCELSEYKNWEHLELLVSMHEEAGNEEKTIDK